MAIRKERSYELTFGLPIDLEDDYWVVANSSYGLIDLDTYNTSGDSDGYQFTKHNMVYNIQKQEKSNNKMEITVDNLSPDARSYLVANKGNDLTIYLKLGYDGTNKLAFQGTITDTITSKRNSTIKTKIVATDGGMNTKNAYSSRVYPAGTSKQTIVNDLMLDLGTPTATVVELPTASITIDPYSVFGSTERNLSRLLEGEGYTGTINNGSYYILPIETMASTTSAYLTTSTGLKTIQILGTTEKKTEVTEADTTDNQRVRFSCQMDATIIPQSSVWIKDETNGIDSAFKIEKCVLSGNYEAGNWSITADAVSFDATITA